MNWLMEASAVPQPEIDYTEREIEDASLRESIASQLSGIPVRVGLYREWDLAIWKGRDSEAKPVAYAVLSDAEGPVWSFHTRGRGFAYAFHDDYLVVTDLRGVMVFQLSQVEMTLHETEVSWHDIQISPTGKYLAAVVAEWAQPDVVCVYDFSSPLTSLNRVCSSPGSDTIVRWESDTCLLQGSVTEVVHLPGHALDGRDLLSLSVQDFDEIEREESVRGRNAFVVKVNVSAHEVVAVGA